MDVGSHAWTFTCVCGDTTAHTTYIYLFIYVWVNECTYACIYTYGCIHLGMHITDIHESVCVCIECMYLSIYAGRLVHMYMHTYVTGTSV